MFRNSLVSPAAQSLNTLNALRLNTQGLANAQVHTGQARQNILADTNKASAYASNYGLGGKGAFLTEKQASSSGGGLKGLNENFTKPFVTASAQVAPYAIPGAGAFVGKGASLLTRAAIDGGLNAVVGAGSNAADQLANTGKLNTKQALESGAISGAAAAVLPVTGAAAKKALPVVGSKIVDKATLKPHSNISDVDLATAAKVRNSMQGGPVSGYDLTSKDVQTYRVVQKKLGVGVNDHSAVDDAIGKRMTYETKKAQTIASLKNINDQATQFSRQHGLLGNAGAAVDDAGNPIGLNGKPLSTGDSVATMPKPELSATGQLEPKPQLPLGSKGNALVKNTPQVIDNGLTRGAKDGRQNLSEEAQSMVQGEHTVRNTNELDKRSVDAANKLSDDDLINSASEQLNTKLGSVSDDTVALTNQAIERAEAAGRTREAVDLHDALSEHLTAHGQAAQAASLLYRLSPNGLLYKGLRDLKKSGAPASKELEDKLRSLSQDVRNAPDEASKKRATTILQKKVADSLPRTASQDLLSIWKAGLLSGVKTQQGNALSNGTFALLKKASDVPSSIVDRGLSLVTGERSKVATLRGGLSGAKEGSAKGLDTLKTGVDERNITGDKYEQHGELNFSNPVINAVFAKPTNLVFRSMSAADQPFYYAAAKNNLYDLALVQAKNNGLKGAERDSFVQNLVDNPSKKMAETAKTAADKAVLGYDTIASKAISSINKSIDNADVPPAFKSTAHIVVNVLAPFTKVPTAFLSRTIDFTPAGPFKEAIGQISSKQFDQRALSEAIGQGMTGTGVIALGVSLAQNNLLSGDYPKSDPKEAQRWKAEGITPNSVKLGNKWVSLNYLGPVGLLFNAGRTLQKSDSSDVGSKLAASVGGLGQGLLGQSFLQGFSGFSDAISDPQRSAKSFVNSQVSSVVPAISNDLANVTDKFQRQADTPIEAIKNRVPGLREGNKVKEDVYGNQLGQAAGQLNTLNGVKPSNSLTNKSPAVAEVARLHAVDPSNADLQVTPTAVSRSLTIEGKKVQLSNDERYQLQQKTGQATQNAWNKLISTSEYRNLSDTDKAKALSNLRTDSNTLATRTFVTDNDLGTYSKAASKKVIGLSDTGDVSGYSDMTKSTGGTTIAKNLSGPSKSFLTSYNKQTADERSKASDTQNDYDYKVAQAKFDNDQANGKITPIEAAIKQKSLAKEQVGSKYSKEVRQAYGMSKTALASYIATNPDGKQLYSQLQAYDSDLKNSGQTTSLKYKYGLASSSGSKSSRKSTSGLPSGAKISLTDAISKAKSTNTAVRNAKVRSGNSAKVAFNTKIKKGKNYALTRKVA